MMSLRSSSGLVWPTLFFFITALLLPNTASAAHHNSDAGAQWVLDAASSSLSFVSVKAGEVAEAHKFGALSGGIAEKREKREKRMEDGAVGGEVNIYIDLTTVNTNVAIRDERMREHLFETAEYPKASVHGHLPLGSYLELDAGETTSSSVKLMLNLHGVKLPVTAEVLVSRLADDRILVASTKPVILSAAGFNLAAGIEKLRELANLSSISGAVPVSFVLSFARVEPVE